MPISTGANRMCHRCADGAVGGEGGGGPIHPSKTPSLFLTGCRVAAYMVSDRKCCAPESKPDPSWLIYLYGCLCTQSEGS